MQQHGLQNVICCFIWSQNYLAPHPTLLGKERYIAETTDYLQLSRHRNSYEHSYSLIALEPGDFWGRQQT